MKTIRIKYGDYGYGIEFTVLNADGTVRDLTGYDVYLKVWDSSGNTILDKLLTVSDAVNGKAVYVVGQSDFTNAGRYYAEIELRKSGSVESTETFTIIVERSI